MNEEINTDKLNAASFVWLSKERSLNNTKDRHFIPVIYYPKDFSPEAGEVGLIGTMTLAGDFNTIWERFGVKE